jgi:hypothetical protein
VRPEGLGELEKIHLIGKRSRDLPVCSLVPQPLRYRVPPHCIDNRRYLMSNKYERMVAYGEQEWTREEAAVVYLNMYSGGISERE